MTPRFRLQDRRRFIQISLATAGSFAVAPSFGFAAALVPEVDSLTLHTVVDNATFGPFLPDIERPGLSVNRSRETGGSRVEEKALIGEFGLSILGVSRIGDQTRRLLVDFGHTAEALSNNMELLGLDAARIDAAVLSHGHLDHYGGYPGLFAGAMPPAPIPLYLGGEETFCERAAMVGPSPLLMGPLDRAELLRAGLNAIIAPEPRLIADHAYTTGIIPLHTIERAAIPTHMRPGAGCNAAELSASKAGVSQVPDDGEHELATFYAVKGMGLVVIASCSHRGVINSVRQAQAISGIERVHAVVGGFHLVRPRTDDEALWTVSELAKLDPAYVIPMHCSGDVFVDEARRVMPEKVIKPYVGSAFTFTRA
jgi:7,8-dihydropterin-6-yl-methyl-4-(beta-D-ribofuranosyl)aminobenzene 5'-phosphate synthase